MNAIVREENNPQETPVNNIKGLLENIGDLNVDGLGLDEMKGLLQLPDEEFKLLTDRMLIEAQKIFKDSSERLAFIGMVKQSGIDPDDLIIEYTRIIDNLENSPEIEGISQLKLDFFKQYFTIILNAILETRGVGKKLIVPVELCDPEVQLPTYAHMEDAGMDIYANEDIVIHPGETKLIHTGIKVAVPVGYELQVRPRSGLSLKTRMRVANAPGTIDPLYRDEVCVILENLENPIKDISYEFDDEGHPVITSILHGSDYEINKGDRIAQLVLNETIKIQFEKVINIGQIEGDRNGGFGSTGK